MKRDVIGVDGASCGVDDSVLAARRHPEVKSLVLLAGSTDLNGRKSGKRLVRYSDGGHGAPVFRADVGLVGAAIAVSAPRRAERTPARTCAGG